MIQIEYKSHSALINALLSLEEANPSRFVSLCFIDYIIAVVLFVAPPVLVLNLSRVLFLREATLFRLHWLSFLQVFIEQSCLILF